MASKQSHQKSQESAGQSEQQKQREWERPSWLQSANYKLKRSARTSLQVAVKPHYQFAVIGLLQFLSGQCPILDACMTAVAASTGGFQSVLRTVLTVQACQLLWAGCQCLHCIC